MSATTRQIVLACGVVVLNCGVVGQSAWPRIFVGNIVARAAVRASLDGAVQRLRDPDCSSALSGLRGVSGESLRATLEQRAPNWAAYLQSLYFSEGTAGSACQRRNVSAFTAI